MALFQQLCLMLALIPATMGQMGYQPMQYQFQPIRPDSLQLLNPSNMNATVDYMSALPLGMYNSFVCNKIAGHSLVKRAMFFIFRKYTQSAEETSYQQLLPFISPDERKIIWGKIQYLARLGYSRADTIVKIITMEKMLRAGENGNINNIYDAMINLINSPKVLVQETQKRSMNGVCKTTNAFYCNYIKKLQSNAPFCSTAILSNQVYQLCCSEIEAPSANLPQPEPSIYSRPTDSVVCGVSNTNPALRMGEFSQSMNQLRIVGGVNAERCEYPWMVRLRLSGAMCGGSIIDAYHILTAAHCVEGGRMIEVHAGEYDSNNPYEPNDQKKNVAAIVKHPNYRDLPDGRQENDIAVIKLDSPLQFNDCVQPICLVPKADGNTITPGMQCTVAGWGVTRSGGMSSNILQETTIPTYSGRDCTKYFSKTIPSNANIQLCAGRPVIGGADTCQGDSGGPLFCPVNGRYVQYGVVSYGVGCASAGAAGVYTNVGEMRDFIDNAVNQMAKK